MPYKLTPKLLEQTTPEDYSIRWLVVTLASILCITFFPYLFGGKTFLPLDLVDTMMAPYNAQFGPPQAQNHYIIDGIAQTYPYKALTKEALENGKLAYWNPYILGGYPQYAESLANNFDVFNILLFALSPLDTIHWMTVIELLIAGIGMLLLLRFFGVTPLVNVIFSAGYMLNSMFITSAHYRCTIASFCWIPFVVLMLLRYFYNNKKENVLFASVFLALTFLGGNFQTSFFAAFIVLMVGLLYPSENFSGKLFRRIGMIACIGIVAFALSAIMWLPSIELLFQTLFRGGSLNSTNVFDPYSITQRVLSIPLLLIFFFPGITGDAQSFNLKKIAGVDIMNFNGAIGFLPVLFALWGCWVFRKEKSLRPFIILSLLAILLPIATPLFAILYHRFFIVASFSFCVVGAVAFHSFMQNEIVRSLFDRLFVVIKIFLGLLIGVLAGAWIYITGNYETVFSKFTEKVAGMIPGSAFGTGNESWMYGRVEKTLHYYSSLSPSLWLPLLSAVIILVSLAYYQRGKFSPQNTLLVVLCATTLELFVFTTTWLPTLDTNSFPIFPKTGITTFLQQNSSGDRYTTWRDPSYDPYLLPENSPNIYKIPDMHGYESCTSPSMSIFYKKHVHTDSLDLRLLGLANVNYILTRKHKVVSSNLKQVYASDSMFIYKNLLSKPRAYIAYSAEIAATEEEAVAAMLRPDFDGSKALFTKEYAPPEIPSFTGGKNSVHVDSSGNEEVIISVETDSKGILILTDSYYPGWKCYVKGASKEIYKVNYCMRGVLLDAGRSTLIFRFEPDIFKAGVGISIFSIALLIGAGIMMRKKSLTNK